MIVARVSWNSLRPMMCQLKRFTLLFTRICRFQEVVQLSAQTSLQGDEEGVIQNVPGNHSDDRQTELGIIGDNSTNRQRINRSTLSIVGYRLALETALSVCCLKTKSDDRQIELSIRTIRRYCRMIVWRKIVLTMLSIHRFKRKNSPMITQYIV